MTRTECLERPAEEYTFARGEWVYPVYPIEAPESRFKVLSGGGLCGRFLAEKWVAAGDIDRRWSEGKYGHWFFEDTAHYALCADQSEPVKRSLLASIFVAGR